MTGRKTVELILLGIIAYFLWGIHEKLNDEDKS